MTSNNRLGMTLAGLLIAVSAAACAGNDGAGNGSEAVGDQASALTQPAPIVVPAGPHTGCGGFIECKATSGYPSLVLTCPTPTQFTQAGHVTDGTTFQESVTNITPTYPVAACVSGGGNGSLFQCDGFSTYLASATSTYCGKQTVVGTCNGARKPTSGCAAGWTCCGSDGWECGRCQ